MPELNRGPTPTKRGQHVPLPNVVASGADIAAAAEEIEDLQDQLAAMSNPALFPDYADDTAAAAGGVEVGERYRTGSTLKVRIS